MKLKLNERQYHIIESLEGVTYGVENILNNISVGDAIIISTIDDVGLGITIDLSVNDSDRKFKINRINGDRLSLQDVNSHDSAVVDFSQFDEGILSSGPSKYKISSVKLFRGGQPSEIVRPKNQDPKTQDNIRKTELDTIKKEFINNIKSVSRNEDLILKGKTDYEFKVLDYYKDKVRLKPISSEIKGNGIVTIPFNSIEYDSKENSFKLKYNDGESSYTLDGISSAESRESVESEELSSFKDALRGAKVDDVVKMNNISLELIKADQGSPLMFVSFDEVTDLFFQKHTTDEISSDFKVLVNIGMVDEGDGKIVVPFEIVYNGNQRQTVRANPTSIEVIDISTKNREDKKAEDKKKKDDEEKETTDKADRLKTSVDKERKQDRKKREREKERSEREARVMKKMKSNPILVKAIKKGILPADELLRKIYDKTYFKKSKSAGEKTNTWTDNFTNRSKVRFKLLTDSFELVGKDDSPSFEFGETYVARVFDKSEGKVSLKTKDYKVLIDNHIGGDEFNGIVYVYKEFDQKDKKRVEIKIVDYNA